MAKKSFSADFLDQLGDEPEETPRPAARRGGKKPDFANPTRSMGRGTVQRARGGKDTTKAGQYMRKTITLLPEQVDYIKELAEQDDVGILAFYRWLVDQGLLAYERGERPTPEREVAQDVRLKHWTGRSRN
jgi:hypothetical protein